MGYSIWGMFYKQTKKLLQEIFGGVWEVIQWDGGYGRKMKDRKKRTFNAEKTENKKTKQKM